jgi:hypothetical protein
VDLIFVLDGKPIGTFRIGFLTDGAFQNAVTDDRPVSSVDYGNDFSDEKDLKQQSRPPKEQKKNRGK